MGNASSCDSTDGGASGAAKRSHSTANNPPPANQSQAEAAQEDQASNSASQSKRARLSDESEADELSDENNPPDHDADCTCQPCDLARTKAELKQAKAKIEELQSDRLEQQASSLMEQPKGDSQTTSSSQKGSTGEDARLDDDDDDDDESDDEKEYDWANIEPVDGDYTNPDDLYAFQPSLADHTDPNFTPSSALTGNESFEELLEFYVDYLLEVHTASVADIRTCHTKIHEAIQELRMNWKRSRERVELPTSTRTNLLIRYLTSLLEVIRTQPNRDGTKTSDFATFLATQDVELATLASVKDDKELFEFACDHFAFEPCKTCNDATTSWNPKCGACKRKRSADHQRNIGQLRKAAGFMLKQVGLEEMVHRDKATSERQAIDRRDVVLLCMAPTLLSHARITNVASHSTKLKDRLHELQAKSKKHVIPWNVGSDLIEKYTSVDEKPKVTSSKKLFRDDKNNTMLALCKPGPGTEAELAFTVGASKAFADEHGYLGPCSVHVEEFGHTPLEPGRVAPFWTMESGMPMTQYFDQVLSNMTSEDAIPTVLDLCTGLVTAVFKFNTICAGIHNDLKAANVIILSFDEKEGGCFFDTEGKLKELKKLSRTPTLVVKLIDFGLSLHNTPSPFRRLTSPETNCPQQLRGSRTLLNSIHNDTYALACILLEVFNKGGRLWHPPGAPPVECPPELSDDFHAAIDFDYLNLSDDASAPDDIRDKNRAMRARTINALYRYFVLLYTRNRWVMKKYAGTCTVWTNLGGKLHKNANFLAHVETSSLIYGSDTRRIRRCPVFKSKKAAILGLFHMMHPIPSARLLPEKFLKLCKEGEQLQLLLTPPAAP